MPDDAGSCAGCGARVAMVDRVPMVESRPAAAEDPGIEKSRNVLSRMRTIALLATLGVSLFGYLYKGSGSRTPQRSMVDLPPANETPEQTFGRLRLVTTLALAPSDGDLSSTKTDQLDALIDNLNKIPSTSPYYEEAQQLIKQLSDKKSRALHFQEVMGPKPQALADGKVPAVEEYLSQTLKEYQDSEEITWSTVKIVYEKDEPYWTVGLRLRLKNTVGSPAVHNAVFYLRNNQVLKATGL